ncbi:MAG: endonuclease/exonuclease/phosphatase family protein [Bacteroidetes bacterium]|nr:endonuclease/exonuclease/phosphatase family protein [Bacteroidota bacterium]
MADLTGMEPLFGAFMDYQGGAYGMALLSKLPIVSSTNYRLPDGNEPRTALSAVVELPQTGQLLRFIGIHFYRTEEERLAQAVRLEEYLEDDEVLPTILAGDFNSERGDSVLTYLEKSWYVVDKGEDYLTFSSFDPVKEIDFFMWRPLDSFSIISQELLAEEVISDHRALVIELVVDSLLEGLRRFADDNRNHRLIRAQGSN